MITNEDKHIAKAAGKILQKNNSKKFFTKKFPEAVKENKLLIIIVLILFFGAIGTAYIANKTAPNPVNDFIESQANQYPAPMDIEDGEKTVIEWTSFFLKNNITAIVQNIGLGTFFGVLPIFSLLVNGLLIGFIVPQASMGALATLTFLLPHGVFEITGLILAATCGIKLGIGSYKSIRGKNLEPLKKVGDEIRYIVPSVILLIVIAAFIEGILGAYRDIVISNVNLQIGLIAFSIFSLGLLFLWIGGKFE